MKSDYHFKISQEGLDLIKYFEGCYTKAYKCPAGVWTIGYGHTGDVSPNQVITKVQAENMLKNDLVPHERAVNTLSFSFNLGTGRLKEIVHNTAEECSRQLKLYNRAAGKVLPGLQKRRQAEYDLFWKNSSISPFPSPSPNFSHVPSSSPSVDAIYQVKVVDRNWYPEVTNNTDFAGDQKNPIAYFKLRVSRGSVEYSVHIRGGNWLPKVDGCNINDRKNGYAGNGKVIDAIKICYITPKGEQYKKAKYRIAPIGRNYYPWVYDYQGDGYAGVFGLPIGKVQVLIE